MRCRPITVFLSFFTLLAIPTLVWGADQPPIDTGTTAWMLVSTVPGPAMFYGGVVGPDQKYSQHHDAQFCIYCDYRSVMGGMRLCPGVW